MTDARITPERIARLLEEDEEARRTVERARGALAQLKARLKAEYGLRGLNAGETEVERLRAEAGRLEPLAEAAVVEAEKALGERGEA